MATVKTLVSGNNKLVVNITGNFTTDTADLTNAVLIDRSTLTGPDGVNPPNKIRIDEITWAIGVGYDYFMLEWDDGTDEVIEMLQGQGYMDFRPFGGKSPAADPGTATEGDVIGTTSGGGAGDSYSILLCCTLKS